ncbi:hypothetical protein E3N88_27543 [Mikania micrantha]|uniref:Uncharacterized protein n=1 Tax=Mikania micrantha TaxID=192012 RepID=A0A5N6MZW7_9ASTR|nr:hypothetical protein E3N88_27543 [Mikania micrantha]
MADGTRARIMEESIKGVQEDQKIMRQELNAVVVAMSSLQSSINELIKRTESGSGKKPSGSTSGHDSEGVGLRQQFPEFHLEDKVGAKREGIVMNPALLDPQSSAQIQEVQTKPIRKSERTKEQPKKFTDYIMCATSDSG